MYNNDAIGNLANGMPFRIEVVKHKDSHPFGYYRLHFNGKVYGFTEYGRITAFLNGFSQGLGLTQPLEIKIWRETTNAEL